MGIFRRDKVSSQVVLDHLRTKLGKFVGGSHCCGSEGAEGPEVRGIE